MTGRHDIVFIVIDSVRKDRVSAYGHERETTPVFDALASEATQYENAFVPAPWTLPSHCSMFTGLFPSEHGITNGFTDRNLQLSPEIPTVTEYVSERGYSTAGFSNNPWVGKLSGLNRGFDEFVEWDLEISRSSQILDQHAIDTAYSRLHGLIGHASRQPQALLKRRFFTARLIDRAARWLSETASSPSFTFLNLMEAHSPYYPPKKAFRDLGLEPPGIIEPRKINAKLLAYILDKTDLTRETRKRILEYYDASVRFQDRKLGDLIDHLRSLGTYDNSLIIVCADHGKTLGEHDRSASPPHYTRDININVPLLIKWPYQERSRTVENPVELVDLFGAIQEIENSTTLPTHPAGAFVEDHVPHTGRTASDVVRWHVLSDEYRKIIRSEHGEEFLLEREFSDEEVGDESAYLGVYRDRLSKRVDGLDSKTSETGDKTAMKELSGSVEGQLHDLGYLD